VPKKRFKSAVDRNKVKRLFRESYRLQKSEHLLPYLQNQSFALLFVYSDNKILTQEMISRKLLISFKRLIEETETNK
jgi:ribonuclease P protein component